MIGFGSTLFMPVKSHRRAAAPVRPLGQPVRPVPKLQWSPEALTQTQQAVTRALTECSTLAEAAPRIFEAICQNLGYDWGELWRVDPAANVLHCTQVWHGEFLRMPAMERATRRTTFARGEGIPGTVWLRNNPIWITDLTRNPKFQIGAALARY